MICPKCKEEGRTSKIYPSGAFSTSMFCAPWYDEQGSYHDHDGNWITESFRCSNGHVWSDSRLKPCPTCGPWWEKPPSPCQEASQSLTVEPPTDWQEG